MISNISTAEQPSCAWPAVSLGIDQSMDFDCQSAARTTAAATGLLVFFTVGRMLVHADRRTVDHLDVGVDFYARLAAGDALEGWSEPSVLIRN